ncbi:MAG TPA: ABC transporter ATP-binding protein [Candidatus Portnoybacteria bacterium]|nr:ABC transporter ATP-binding protein [Candidatus Portnoybacteria bacterium]
MLKIQNLKSGYNKMEVLRGVNLELKLAEIVALIGPNGAGKSTILKSIFGLTNTYSGKIIFKEKNITKFKTHELIKLGIGFVPQGRQVFSSMTILENLQMGVFIIKNRDVVERNINDIFKRFPILKEKQNELAGNLSGGQQQLLAIARALIQKPQILLLDEPSLGLAPKVAKEIFEKVIEIKNEGIAVLVVEQNAKQAVGIADRTYILENGKIVMQGSKDILKNEKIRDIYFGSDVAL